MVDEADKTKLIDALHEDARYPTGERTFKERDVATWTEENLRPLPMEKLVELEAPRRAAGSTPQRLKRHGAAQHRHQRSTPLAPLMNSNFSVAQQSASERRHAK